MVIARIRVQRAGSAATLLDSTFRLAVGEHVRFGRGADNELAIQDPEKRISTHHGRFECREDDGLHAIDLGSLNGTVHAGALVDGRDGVRMADGDIIRIGDFELQVQLLAEADLLADEALAAEVAGNQSVVQCERTARRLELLYAEEIHGDRGARIEALQKELRQVLDQLPPEQATMVLNRLAKRFTAGNAPSARPPAAGDSLGAATRAALTELAARYVPSAQLQTVADVQRFGQHLDCLLESLLAFVARSLQGRKVFGEEFGAEVTMVFQRSNNPLKTMTAPRLAEYLLDWREPAIDDQRAHYLQTVLADLTEHQLGILAGVREAITSVVAQLAPANVLARMEPQQGWSLTSKPARAWTTYEQLFAEVVAERGKLFQDVISPGIQRGYLQRHGETGQSPESRP